jgi:hypothetical protein
MAGQTILRSMTHKDLETLNQNLMSDNTQAVESAKRFLEACFESDVESALPETREATADMFLEEISKILSEAQQPANAIVRFSRTPSLEKEFAAELLKRTMTANSH